MKPSTICQGAQGLILALSLVATAAFAQGNSQSNANWRAIDNQTANSYAAQFQRSAGASDPVSIAVVLKLNNPDALNSLITAQHTPGNPSYHQWLSSAESTQQFGPTQAQAQAVADYLTQNGFTHVQIAPNRLLVTADGTATLAQIAFNTLMGVYSNNSGEQGLLNTNVIQVPAALSQIDQVLGLDTLTRAHTRSLPVSNLKPVNVAPGLGSGGTNGYYPDRFASVYNRPVNLTGGNTTVAIVGWGDMNAPSTDLQQFESSRGIAAVPTAILSSSNQGSTDESAQSEWSMDAQAIVGISGGVKQLLFYTSGGTAGSGANTAALASVINQVVSDNTASVINMSWSIAECGNGYGYFDSAFALGASQGQTFSAASGDSGAYPCSAPASGTYGDTNAPSTVYPASSPNVIAVGGTTLTTDANLNYSSESAWPYSGGGISSFETKPDWQNGFAGLYRQVPDLAFDADWSYSPVIMYMNGNMYYNGGTSLAAPLFVGAWAVLESANSNTLGFAPSLLYPVASQLYASSALHDVTTGNNGYYLASAGYDNATGWGSFDITKMLNFLGVTTSTVTTSTGTGGSTSPSGAVSAVSGAIQADTVAAAITLSASPASGAIQANTAAAAITPSATPWTLRTPGLFEDTTFPTAALVSLLFPTKNPPLTNNWSCKPTAAHPEPVVFIHGTFENAYSNWAGMAPIIAAQGYCVYALNYGNTGYPSLNGTGDMVASSAQIAAFIAQVRTATGAAHVALIGHSQGGAQARYYADLLAPAGEVDTVIMIAPSNHAVTLSGLTTLGNLIGVPQLLDALKMPGQAQQSDPKSPFYVQLNGNGETRPGINYTVIATTYDEVATPYTQAFITAGPGATVDNITLQNVCAQDLSEHLSASYSKNVAQIILNKLDPANPHVIKCYTQAPIIGTTAPTAASTPTNTVTASVSGTGGTMSPSGTVSTASGATASFTLKPSTGYAAATVGGTCGGTLTGNTFKTNAITANCTVVATFAPGTYTVTPSAGANGAISPTGGVSVKGASSTTFTLKPNAGYVPSTVTGTCGGTLSGNTFTTKAITTNCTVIANFAQGTYAVTPSVSGTGGTISPATNVSVKGTATTSFTLKPTAGYVAATVNGTCGGTLTGNTFKTNAITANCTVVATFAPGTYTVTPSAGANGAISPTSGVSVKGTSGTTFTLKPNAGYVASTVTGTCGGTLSGNTFTTKAITANCTVIANFTPGTYAVTPSVSGTGGTISPATNVSVKGTATTSLTLKPAAGYAASSVSGTCGGTLTGNTFKTNAITANCTVVATFAPGTYTITPSAGANGAISPTGGVSVKGASSTTFTLKPNAGYVPSTVTGTCGGTLSGNTFTTKAITANCTVIANFAQGTYAVTPSVSGTGGTISPATNVSVKGTAATSFTLKPAAGYVAATVNGTCGGTLTGNTFKTNAITANCTVVATFAPGTYTVTPSAGANGAISPTSGVSVKGASSTTFTLKPNAGYVPSTVTGTCGGTLSGNTFTTKAITANCTVIANFAQGTYTVTPSVSGTGGTISPATNVSVKGTATTSFTLKPAAGYAASSVGGTCGGTLTGNTFKTNPIAANCTVTAMFTK